MLQCNKKFNRYLKETKMGTIYSLEVSRVSCTVNVDLISSLWELPTLKMEPQFHLKYNPFQDPGCKACKSKPLYNRRSVIQSVNQSVLLGIDSVVWFIICLTGVRICPLSAFTVSVGCVCTHTYNCVFTTYSV
jgi:hypothetical protein